MPVYNAAGFLGECIPSILRQSFKGFELLVLDDGSTDASVEVVRGYADPRIRLERNPGNLGVALTLNRGLEMARGEYIARMDADDKAHPERLACQVNFLDRNPEIGILGSWVRLFGDQVPVIERKPTGPEAVKATLLFDTPFFHPTVMIRRSLLEAYGLRYDPTYTRTEDYELWSRVADFCNLDNLPKALVSMRVHAENITATTKEAMTRQTLALLTRHLNKIGISVNIREAAFHHHVGRGRRMSSLDEVHRAEAWIRQIIQAAVRSGKYTPKGMSIAAGMTWFRLCRNSSNLGPGIWRAWRSSPLSKSYVPCRQEYFRWLASIAWHMLPGKRKRASA